MHSLVFQFQLSYLDEYQAACDSVAFFRWFCLFFGVGGGSSKYRPRLIRSLSQLVHSLAVQVLANVRTIVENRACCNELLLSCLATKISTELYGVTSHSICLSLVCRRRERRKRERQSSESEKDEVRDSAIESNRLDTEISVNISTAEGEERAAKHKSKKKRKKRSVESVSPSSSKRRHHKKRKHKRRGSDSREPEKGKFDREGTVENPTHEGEEEEKNFKVAKSAPEAVGNCGNKNIATDKGSPDSGTPNSDPSHAKPVPQGSPVA